MYHSIWTGLFYAPNFSRKYVLFEILNRRIAVYQVSTRDMPVQIFQKDVNVQLLLRIEIDRNHVRPWWFPAANKEKTLPDTREFALSLI